jgi:hypothetical protein
MKALTFRLWDERERKLVGFGGARAHRREAARRRGLIGERSPGKARPQVSV